MAQTKIKAGLFEGIIGNGTDGYYLMSNGDGTMTWSSIIENPTITSLAYPGSVTAADPAGGETITMTGTGFKTGATVTVGGTAAPAVSYVSGTQITFTTPAKAAGDYDIVVTNTDTGSATYINGISYNGIPSWTTAAGSLGTFASGATISTITLQATEPDAGTITFNITNGALPTGLSLTGADIDGTTSLETADTLYTFTVTATDDESQATPRTFTITVNKEFKSVENFTINTYTGNGGTQSIEGKIGTAASFNGSSSYISANNSISQQAFSISFWVNYTDTNLYRVLLAISDGTDNNSFFINTQPSGGIGFALINSGGYIFNTTHSTTGLNDGNWHHIAFTWDGTTSTNAVKIHIDNTTTQTTSTTSAASVNSWNSLTLGDQRVGRGVYFTGKIDQVRIFDKALLSSEVTTLYGESNTSTTKSTTDIFDDGSGVALYEFEKGAVDTGGVTGYIGSGGMFNGSSSNISLPTSIKPADSIMSISLWASNNSTARKNIFYLEYNNAPSFLALENNLYTDSTALGVYYNNAIVITAPNETLPADGSWHHIVVTASATEVKLYKNGSQIGSTASVTVNTSALTEAHIGVRHYNNDLYWDGKIDQVRIFNRVLDEATDGEVTTLYNETSASSTKSTTDIFDDGSGVALYELEGNAKDTGVPIDSGQSAVFDGSSSYIQLDSNSSINSNNNFSWSVWVNFSSLTDYDCIIALRSVYGNTLSIMADGRIRLYEGTEIFSSSGVVTTNTWYHIVWTKSSTEGSKIYLNDSLIKTDTRTTNSPSSSGLNLFGASASATPNFFLNGKLDQVRIYSSALSASDVEALASETNVPTANLVAHYKLDGNANDETTNYNGTASNVTYSAPAEFPTHNGTATNVTYAYDGTPTNVSFVGTSFQPDLVWIKSRSGVASHSLQDTVRGAGQNYNLYSDNTAYEGQYGVYGYLSSFDTNGFEVIAGAYGDHSNKLGENYVAWCWKAGGAAVSNTDGTITSTVSANQDAGFSIVKYVGSSTSGLDIGHGLSSAPEMVILKNLDSSTNWYIYHKDTGTTSGYINYLKFDATTGTYSDKVFYPVDFNNSTFIAGHDTVLQGNMIAYCFHSVDGYQKVGGYTGSGASGNVINVGFEPRFLLTKSSSDTAYWYILDNVRNASNPRNSGLFPNDSLAEITSTNYNVDFNSNGFTLQNNTIGFNQSGETYIYLAIA